MQSFPQAPVPTWTSIGLIAVAAVLALVALVVILVVVVASNRSILSSPAAKAFGSFLLIGLPVLALFGLLSLFGLFVAGIAVPLVSRVESGGIHDEVWGHGTRAASRRTTDPNELIRMHQNQADAVWKQEARQIPRETTGPAESRDRLTQPAPVTGEREVEVSQTTTVFDDGGNKKETIVVVEAPAGRAEVEAALYPNRDGRQAAPAAMAISEDTAPLSGVLRVRGSVNKEPDWASQGPVPGEKGILVPVSSQRFATLDEAEQQVTRLAIGYIKSFYANEHPARGVWNVPVSIIEQNAVNTIVSEEIEKDFGKMYRAHLRLNLSDRLRSSLQESWHEQVVTQRLEILGGSVGLITLVLATAAGYFRLDTRTNGQYRGRLRLAAASLIGAAGLVAVAGMYVASGVVPG